MRFRLTSILLALVVLGFGSGTASAQSCQGAPGTSAVDQYCESVPSAGGGSGNGSNAGNGGGSGSGGQNAPESSGSGSSTVSPSTSAQLDEAGESGQALNQLLDEQGATSRQQPKQDKAKGGSPKKPEKTATVDTPSEPSQNPLAAVKSAATDGAVLGGPLVWALLAVTLLAVGLGVVRARSKS